MSSRSKIKNSKLPFVFSNLAMTADGKIAFGHWQFVPFGSKWDGEHMMELRATADAVMCGARTIEVTQTILGNGGEKFRRQRLKLGLAQYPLRIIVSGSGSIDPAAKIFKKKFSPIIILTTARITKINLEKLRGVADEVKICGKTEVHFPTTLHWLREKWNVRRLLCEGGGELHGALVRADLMDELHLTVCPKIFGGSTTPTLADGRGISSLANAAQFQLKSAQRVGDELFAVFNRRDICQ